MSAMAGADRAGIWVAALVLFALLACKALYVYEATHTAECPEVPE